MIYATFDDNGLPTGYYDETTFGAFGKPGCRIPDGAIAITDAQHTALLEVQGGRRWQDGQVVAYEPPVSPEAAKAALIASFGEAIDQHLDARAAERRYDSITTAASYRDDPNPQYAAEGQALFNWRSAVWTYVTAQLAAVEAGTREQPTVEAFLAEIDAQCPFAWPEATA